MAELDKTVNEIANAMKYAMHMELEGRDFYLDKADDFANPTTRELFKDLAKEEESHYKFLEQEMNNFVGDPDKYQMDEDYLHEEDSIFEKRAESQKIDVTLQQSDIPDMTALRMAYLIEADFAEYYENLRDRYENPGIKEVFAMLGEWERGHEKMFKDEYNRLLKEYMSMPWGG